MRKLDRNRSHGEVRGTERSGARFVQDGILFDGQGNELGAKPEKKGRQKLPPPADYSDEVNDEHLRRIKATVPESEYRKAVVDSPVIDLDQPFFSLRAEVARRTGKTPKNKNEARQFAEDAGLLP